MHDRAGFAKRIDAELTFDRDKRVMSVTKRDNLRRVLRGESPDWVPFAPNFKQWYQHHREHGTLPEELASSNDYLDAVKTLEADIFSRNLDVGLQTEYDDGCAPNVESVAGDQRPRTITRWSTPHGELRSVSEVQAAMSAHYQVEDLVKDWDRDRPAYMWILERIHRHWDPAPFDAMNARVGDDGLILVSAGPTPLKKLHVDFGLDGASFFMMDEPDAARSVCDVYWERTWPALQALAADDRIDAIIFMDNVDTPFYPPAFARLYWAPYVRQAVDLFEPAGKRVFVHACGQLRGLVDVFRECGVHGLEGMAHPPLGDFRISDAKAIHDLFIYNGGFSAHEQVTMSDDEVRAFYDRFFEELDGWPRFVFGAACQTAITTTWERIKLVRDCCRRHGGAPTDCQS